MMRRKTWICGVLLTLIITQPLAAEWSLPWSGKNATSSKSKPPAVTIKSRKKEESNVVSRMSNGAKRAVSNTKNLLTPSGKKSKPSVDKTAAGYHAKNALETNSGGFKSLFVREESHPSKTVRDFMQAERVKP